MNGVLAIVYADLKRFSKSKPALVSLVLMPILILSLVHVVFSGIAPNEMSYILSNFVIFMAILPAFSAGMTLVVEKQYGMFKELLAAPLSEIDIVLGKVFSASIIVLVPPFVLLLVSLLLGIIDVQHPVFSATALILISITLSSLSVAVAFKISQIQSFQYSVGLALFPLFILSSIVLPLKSLPSPIKEIALINPLSHAMDLFRFSVGKFYELPPLQSLGVLGLFSIASFVLCFVVAKKQLARPV